MQLKANQNLFDKIQCVFSGKDYYRAPNGIHVSVKKDTGTVELTNGILKVNNADKVVICGTKKDDKILVKDSFVKSITTGLGDNQTVIDNCKFKKYNEFWGIGSIIKTGGGAFSSYKKGSDKIQINGDFNGAIFAQQGAGKAYGDDSKSHKDQIFINGNFNGYVTLDTIDSIAIKGKKDGKIVNVSHIVM